MRASRVETEDVIREGAKGEEINQVIDEDEDIAILVLGASTDAAGPGPLVASLAAGTAAGNFAYPGHGCPGQPHLAEIQALGLMPLASAPTDLDTCEPSIPILDLF